MRGERRMTSGTGRVCRGEWASSDPLAHVERDTDESSALFVPWSLLPTTINYQLLQDPCIAQRKEWECLRSSEGHKCQVSERSTSEQTHRISTAADETCSIAAAFHAAQTGHFPTPNPDLPYLTKQKPPPAPIHAVVRAQSPSEQLASVARALSPVRYFLRPTEDGDLDGSGEFNSFGSLGSGETSYDYRQEEEYVRQIQSAKAFAPKKGPRTSDPKKRNGRAAAGDMPYRPTEDEFQYDSEESGGEGEGVVRAGALEARAETRGKRQEKGEGYLGMGLGIQPSRAGGRGRVGGVGPGPGRRARKMRSQSTVIGDTAHSQRSSRRTGTEHRLYLRSSYAR